MSAIENTDIQLVFNGEEESPTEKDSKVSSIAETAAKRLIPGTITEQLPTPRIPEVKTSKKKEKAILDIWNQHNPLLKNRGNGCDQVLGFDSEERQKLDELRYEGK
jgi:hypothetical protein